MTENLEKSFMTSFKTNPQREASDSIRGYVYQAYQSVLAWIRLRENEILILEGAEDFDIHLHGDNTVTTNQVKNTSSNITLRSPDIKEAINNFWYHSTKNPEYQIRFRFMTTAKAGQEQGAPFGDHVKGLEYWHQVQRGENISPLRSFLLTLNLNEDINSFINNAIDDEIKDRLVCSIHWDLDCKPYDSLIYDIEDKLIFHGYGKRINAQDSKKVLPHLLRKVTDLLSNKGNRSLRYSDFLCIFDEATMERITRSELEQLKARNRGFLTQDDLLFPSMVNTPRILTNPLPLVAGALMRDGIVTQLVTKLRCCGAIFLQGSNGIGKTNLARLVADKIGGDWGWIGFRALPPDEIRGRLSRAAFEIYAFNLSPLLVLDDLDLGQVSQFEHELITLVFSIINANGFIIITSTSYLPNHLFPKLWLDTECEYCVPFFDEVEVSDLIRNNGLSDSKLIDTWTKIIFITTSGHPQLVHARVRNLSTQNWKSNDRSDFFQPTDVENAREEARKRFSNEFPSKEARLLAYRLSLITDLFTRDTAFSLASIKPEIPMPGETFDLLVGPWIERENNGFYRISALSRR